MTITALPDPPSRSDPANFSDEADAFLGALPTFVTEANALAAAMNLNDTTASSTTSLAIGMGSKSLTVDTGKSYQVGMPVMIANSSSAWMHGNVTSYNSGTGALVVLVSVTDGSGTLAVWTVSLSGPPADAVESNVDVDTGTETVDSFADTVAKAAFWSYVVSKGANLRAGTIMAAWDASGNTIEYTEMSTPDVGDTSDLTLSVDINSDTVRLRATASSDDWSVEVTRRRI